MEVVPFVPPLGKALWNLKGMYDQHVENGNEIKELQSFIQDYDQQIPILRERFQKGGGNVMGIAAFKTLEKDVIDATNQLEKWSKNKSFFRVFNSAERMQKLGKLHSKVMASIQNNLAIANLSMLLDMQATQATFFESNEDLKSLLITSIGSRRGTLPTEVRDEVEEVSTSSFVDPKFWVDVLAAVDNHNAGFSSAEDKNMYEDPITTNLMIDPVVASNGNTYCRWTIIDHNLTRNPFNVDEDLTIVIDNLNFRRGLFEKFPRQAQIFAQRRKQYRSHALSLKAQGLWGDAVLALQYALQWDKHDVECVEALEQVQGALQEAKDKYLQPSMGLSNDSCNGGPSGSSMHRMVAGTSKELHEAYKLSSSLSSSIPGGQHRDSYDAMESIAKILMKGPIGAHEPAARLFFNLSTGHSKESIIGNSMAMLALVTSLGDGTLQVQKIATKILKNLLPDAIKPIAKILKKGSTRAREQAARIFFNLSTSLDRKIIIGNFVAILALVTSLGNGTLQVQRIATNTLNNLFPDALEFIAKILMKGSIKAREKAARVFFDLSMTLYRKNIIGNSAAMLALVTSLSDEILQVQDISNDTLNNLFPDALHPIAKIMKNSSPEACEQAARIFFNFSMSPDRKSIIGDFGAMLALVTSFGNGTLQVQQIATDTLNNLFPDALKPIAEILKEGSTEAREQAARILFNLSTSHDRRSVIGNSIAMLALVTSLGHGTLQVQQIVASTLNNLCCHSLNEMKAIEAGLVPTLLRLIVERPETMLEEALQLVNEVLNFSNRSRSCHVIRMEAPASIWLEIMASKSRLNRERAASILYTLCYDNQHYSQQARECEAYKQIRQFTLLNSTKRILLELLKLNVSERNYPKRQEIPFPKKDWWSPQRD